MLITFLNNKLDKKFMRAFALKPFAAAAADIAVCVGNKIIITL